LLGELGIWVSQCWELRCLYTPPAATHTHGTPIYTMPPCGVSQMDSRLRSRRRLTGRIDENACRCDHTNSARSVEGERGA